MTYKHVIRSWLFGALEIARNKNLTSTDLEVHAVGAILHDLGWDQTPGSKLISSDKRFKVDGAIAARDFLRSHPDGNKWDSRRVQLVWDSIAFHGTPSFSSYKEAEVNAVGLGVFHDVGPRSGNIDKVSYDRTLSEYSRTDIIAGLTGKMVWFCQTKPATTYGL
jgi:hypothetical protein